MEREAWQSHSNPRLQRIGSIAREKWGWEIGKESGLSRGVEWRRKEIDLHEGGVSREAGAAWQTVNTEAEMRISSPVL